MPDHPRYGRVGCTYAVMAWLSSVATYGLRGPIAGGATQSVDAGIAEYHKRYGLDPEVTSVDEVVESSKEEFRVSNVVDKYQYKVVSDRNATQHVPAGRYRLIGCVHFI